MKIPDPKFRLGQQVKEVGADCAIVAPTREKLRYLHVIACGVLEEIGDIPPYQIFADRIVIHHLGSVLFTVAGDKGAIIGKHCGSSRMYADHTVADWYKYRVLEIVNEAAMFGVDILLRKQNSPTNESANGK